MSTVILVAGLVVLVGATVQGVVGYGLNLLAGPLLALLDPALVPVPALVIACVQAVLAVARERGHVDWRGVAWAMTGRIPGNVVGVLVLSALPARGFTLAVGASVLVCVGMSLLTWSPSPTRSGLVLAGTASGAFGTTSAIGGPPVALLYQNSDGPTVRATLGAYFVLSSLSSLATLAVAGQVHTAQAWTALALIPFMLAGFALSGPLRRFLDGGRVRPGVLGVAAVAATVLLVKSALG